MARLVIACLIDNSFPNGIASRFGSVNGGIQSIDLGKRGQFVGPGVCDFAEPLESFLGIGGNIGFELELESGSY